MYKYKYQIVVDREEGLNFVYEDSNNLLYNKFDFGEISILDSIEYPYFVFQRNDYKDFTSPKEANTFIQNEIYESLFKLNAFAPSKMSFGYTTRVLLFQIDHKGREVMQLQNLKPLKNKITVEKGLLRNIFSLPLCDRTTKLIEVIYLLNNSGTIQHYLLSLCITLETILRIKFKVDDNDELKKVFDQRKTSRKQEYIALFQDFGLTLSDPEYDFLLESNNIGFRHKVAHGLPIFLISSSRFLDSTELIEKIEELINSFLLAEFNVEKKDFPLEKRSFFRIASINRNFEFRSKKCIKNLIIFLLEKNQEDLLKIEGINDDEILFYIERTFRKTKLIHTIEQNLLNLTYNE